MAKKYQITFTNGIEPDELRAILTIAGVGEFVFDSYGEPEAETQAAANTDDGHMNSEAAVSEAA